MPNITKLLLSRVFMQFLFLQLDLTLGNFPKFRTAISNLLIILTNAKQSIKSISMIAESRF